MEREDVLSRFKGVGINRCGPFALQACAEYVGAAVHHDEIVDSLSSDGQMTDFRQLRDATEKLGLVSAAVRWHGDLEIPPGAPAILAVQWKARRTSWLRSRPWTSGLDYDFPNIAWTDCETIATSFTGTATRCI